jgi:hypothetical protein
MGAEDDEGADENAEHNEDMREEETKYYRSL